jgi:hypothetical protein
MINKHVSTRGGRLGGRVRPCRVVKTWRPTTKIGAPPPTPECPTGPALLARIKAQAKAPLKDAVNATLDDMGLPLETSSGGRTRYNRCRPAIAKSHAVDAACVGAPGTLVGWQIPSTAIKATGRGDYWRTNPDRHGFSRDCYTRARRVRGFHTGDPTAEVPKGARNGVHAGRVAVPVTGSFRVGNAEAIVAQYCKLLHRANGCSYAPRFLCGRASAPAGASARRFW